MKRKLTVLAVVGFVALIALGLYLVLRRVSVGRRDGAVLWAEFCLRAGSLQTEGSGIDYYCRSLEVLAANGVPHDTAEDGRVDWNIVQIPDEAWSEFSDDLLKAAEAVRMGGEIRKTDPWTSHLCAPAGDCLEPSDFRLICRANSQLADRSLADGNTEAALKLGFANIALGTQLTNCKDKLLALTGCGARQLGLKTLEKVASARHDEELTDSVKQMVELNDRDFQTIRNSPDAQPGTWELFKYITQ